MALESEQPRWLPEPGVPPITGECHLWLVRLPWAAADVQLLDAAEREQFERFRADSARRMFLASRTLQRRIGARYTDGEPGAIVIDRTCEHCGGDHGRPKIPASAIDYSVSHAGDVLVIAVVGAGRVGVDVEHTRQRATDLDDLARAIMAPREMACYRAMAAPDRPAFFYRMWTRKEAVVKLTGHGLAQSLSGVDVMDEVVPAGTIARGGSDYDIRVQDLASSQDYPLSLASTREISVVRYPTAQSWDGENVPG